MKPPVAWESWSATKADDELHRRYDAVAGRMGPETRCEELWDTDLVRAIRGETPRGWPNKFGDDRCDCYVDAVCPRCHSGVCGHHWELHQRNGSYVCADRTGAIKATYKGKAVLWARGMPHDTSTESKR